MNVYGQGATKSNETISNNRNQAKGYRKNKNHGQKKSNHINNMINSMTNKTVNGAQSGGET